MPNKPMLFNKKTLLKSTALLLGAGFFVANQKPVQAEELTDTAEVEVVEEAPVEETVVVEEVDQASPVDLVEDVEEEVVEADLAPEEDLDASTPEEISEEILESVDEETADSDLDLGVVGEEVSVDSETADQDLADEEVIEESDLETDQDTDDLADDNDVDEEEVLEDDIDEDGVVKDDVDEEGALEETLEDEADEDLDLEAGDEEAEDLVEEDVEETEEDTEENSAVDYEYLLDYAKTHPEDFQKQLGVFISLAAQNHKDETDAGTILALVEVITSDNYDAKAIEELSKLLFNDTEKAEDDEEVDQKPPYEVNTDLPDLSHFEDSLISGQPGANVSGSKLLDPAVLSGEKEIDFGMVMDNVVGVSDSVVSLLEDRAQGKVTGAGVGAIIDSILPTGSIFTNIGGLIQRIAELRAENLRQDVLQGTEIVGMISELIPSSVEFNGTPVNHVLNKLGSMAYDIGSSVAQGMLLPFNPGSFYNPNTYRLRGRLFAEASKAAYIATNEWRMKPQVVHSKIGLEIAHAYMAVVDPFSNVKRLTTRLNALAEMVLFGYNYRDITPEDVATIYFKKELSEAIWDVRFKRDKNILGKVPFEVYHNLNKQITKAVGVQLNPNTKVKDIDGAVAAVKDAYAQAESYFTETPFAEQRASKEKVRELKDLIWEVRSVRDKQLLGNIAFKDYHALNRQITSAVGTQLKVKKTNGDVDQAIADLKAALATAVSVASI